jgi:hypothetical protein
VPLPRSKPCRNDLSNSLVSSSLSSHHAISSTPSLAIKTMDAATATHANEALTLRTQIKGMSVSFLSKLRSNNNQPLQSKCHALILSKPTGRSDGTCLRNWGDGGQRWPGIGKVRLFDSARIHGCPDSSDWDRLQLVPRSERRKSREYSRRFAKSLRRNRHRA